MIEELNIIFYMQVLDPTSRKQQSGMYRIGPVPVEAVKKYVGESMALITTGKGEGKREDKRRQSAVKGSSGQGKAMEKRANGAEYIVSEVNADLRFLRVSKSYASITNQIMSVALVCHNKVGVRIVAGNGDSLDPLNVTDTYKWTEINDEAPPTHSHLPTRDCSVEVSTTDTSKLGEEVELTVTVTNHGHLLRTLDGRVEGHIVR